MSGGNEARDGCGLGALTKVFVFAFPGKRNSNHYPHFFRSIESVRR